MPSDEVTGGLESSICHIQMIWIVTYEIGGPYMLSCVSVIDGAWWPEVTVDITCVNTERATWILHTGTCEAEGILAWDV